MFRAIPVSNKIIERKSVERSRQKHEQKLNELKPAVPDQRPASYDHHKHNKKKEQQLEERYTEIERCNRLLLERLTGIMKKSNSTQPTPPKHFRVRSLNRDSRKRDLVKITIENQSMLRRIQDRKSQYSVNGWLEGHRKEQKYLQNISEYPIKLYSGDTSHGTGGFYDDLEPENSKDTSVSRELYFFVANCQSPSTCLHKDLRLMSILQYALEIDLFLPVTM